MIFPIILAFTAADPQSKVSGWHQKSIQWLWAIDHLMQGY